MVAAAKGQTRGLPDAQCQFRYDHAVGATADAVSPEILTNHFPLQPRAQINRGPMIGPFRGQISKKKGKSCALMNDPARRREPWLHRGVNSPPEFRLARNPPLIASEPGKMSSRPDPRDSRAARAAQP